MEYLAARLAAIPGVVAVTLGGSRATGTAVEGSDLDFGLYYRGGLDPADIAALGWPGQVFAPGEWGDIVNGGAWLTVGGIRVDLIYRNLYEVLRWTAAAADGRFEIRREVGYVAGIATYILAGELALGRVLAGDLPRPEFPPALLSRPGPSGSPADTLPHWCGPSGVSAGCGSRRCPWCAWCRRRGPVQRGPVRCGRALGTTSM